MNRAPQGDTFCACGRRLGKRRPTGRCSGCAGREAAKSPEWRAKAGACTPAKLQAARNRTERQMAWCPTDLRETYRLLVHKARYSAAEAKAMLLEQIGRRA